MGKASWAVVSWWSPGCLLVASWWRCLLVVVAIVVVPCLGICFCVQKMTPWRFYIEPSSLPRIQEVPLLDDGLHALDDRSSDLHSSEDNCALDRGPRLLQTVANSLEKHTSQKNGVRLLGLVALRSVASILVVCGVPCIRLRQCSMMLRPEYAAMGFTSAAATLL